MRFRSFLAAVLCFLLACSILALPLAEEFSSLPETYAAQDFAEEEFLPAEDFAAQEPEEAGFFEETDLRFVGDDFYEDEPATPVPSVTPVVLTPTVSPIPTPVPEKRTEPFIPAVDAAEEGFSVTGLEKPFAFPEDITLSFTVTGASAKVRYGDNLYPQDGMWVPQYWTLDADSTKRDFPSDPALPAESRTMYLSSSRAVDHTLGIHSIQVYFCLFVWSGNEWLPLAGGTVVSPVTVNYTVARAEDVTPTPTPSPTPLPTARAGYIPEVTSAEDGFKVEGLEEAIPLAENERHIFTVYGASAAARYGVHLVAGDGKWSPVQWTGSASDLPEGDTRLAIDAKEMTIQSPTGLYGPSRNLTIYVYFRLFIYDGTNWMPTETMVSVPQLIKAAAITPTPSPKPTPSPTPIPVPSGTVSLSESAATLYKNSAKAYKKITLEATLTGDCVGKPVVFTSSKPTVATVGQNGVVTAKTKGKTTITAKVTVGKSVFKAKCKITVKKPTLKLSNESLSLNAGEKATLGGTATPAAKLDFSSTDKKVATVTRKGVVTGVKAGSCDIVVTANKVSVRCHVTVQ